MGGKRKNQGLAMVAIGAVITTAIGLIMTQGVNVTVGDLGQKARIDYSLQNSYGNIAACYFSDPHDPLNKNNSLTSSPSEIPVYLRNRGDADGALELTLHAQGAKVAISKDGPFDYTAAKNTGIIPNTGTWDLQSPFYIIPDPNQTSISLWVTAKGIGFAEPNAYTTTSVILEKYYAGFQCKR